MVQELNINYDSLILRLQSITIVVSDAEGEREGSEHVLEDSDWDFIDNNETHRYRGSQNMKGNAGVVQGGCSGYRGLELWEMASFCYFGGSRIFSIM